MSAPDHRTPPPTLEDILRLKRAERPSPEFWLRFENELRQKQLVALMERRPWWQTLPRQVFQSRAFMPVGAAAVLTMAMISVRLYGPQQLADGSSQPAAPAGSPVQVASVAAPVNVAAVPMKAAVVEEKNLVVEAKASAVASLSSQLPEHANEIIPWGTAQTVQSLTAMLQQSQLKTPASPLLQASFASVTLPAMSLRSSRPVEATVELASVSEQNSKRSRLLAQLAERQFTPDPRVPANMRERLARRLADASLNDHITRIGLKGDQVSLRF